MSFAQLSALTNLQQSDYAAIAILTAVAYDYSLTFSDEIKYIWSKPWSGVTISFIIVRYLGIVNLITCSLLGSSFLPGPTETYVFFLTLRSRLLDTANSFGTAVRNSFVFPSFTLFIHYPGEIIYTIDTWVFDLFLGAADFVMMLRVWAMYHRSKPILGILLALLSLQIIFSIIAAAMNSDPRNASAPSVKIMDVSFCSVFSTPVWTNEATVVQIMYGAAMCLLAIVQFVRESLQMYNVTKRWQPSRYMSLLTREGILYFLAIFLYNLMNLLSDFGKFPTGGWKMILLIILNYVPVFTLTPRFILSIRELYAHDVQGGSGEEIDTGFGLSASSHDTRALTAIVFADIEQNGGLGDIKEVGTAETV